MKLFLHPFNTQLQYHHPRGISHINLRFNNKYNLERKKKIENNTISKYTGPDLIKIYRVKKPGRETDMQFSGDFLFHQPNIKK